MKRHSLMIGPQVKLPSLSTFQGLVVRLLADTQIPILLPIVIITVVAVHSVSSATDLALGSIVKELLVLALIELGLLFENFRVVHYDFGNVDLGDGFAPGSWGKLVVVDDVVDFGEWRGFVPFLSL